MSRVANIDAAPELPLRPFTAPGDSGEGTDAGKRRDTEAAALRVLQDVGRSLSPREVMAELQARGVLTRGPYAVRGALGTLAKRGVIAREGDGRGTRYAAK